MTVTTEHEILVEILVQDASGELLTALDLLEDFGVPSIDLSLIKVLSLAGLECLEEAAGMNSSVQLSQFLGPEVGMSTPSCSCIG